MRPFVPVVTALLAGLALAAAPTPAALRKAFEHNRQSVVKVTGARGRAGPGVVVGASGHVLTSVDYVTLHTAQVEVDGQAHTADVVLADAYQGIAVVQVRGEARLRATPVQLDAEVAAGQSLVAVRLGSKGPTPRVVVVRRLGREGDWFSLNATLSRGTPLFDGRGRLVGVVVSGRKALPVSKVKQSLTASAG